MSATFRYVIFYIGTPGNTPTKWIHHHAKSRIKSKVFYFVRRLRSKVLHGVRCYVYFDIATIEILQNYFAKLHGLYNGNQHKNDSVLMCFDTPRKRFVLK